MKMFMSLIIVFKDSINKVFIYIYFRIVENSLFFLYKFLNGRRWIEIYKVLDYIFRILV